MSEIQNSNEMIRDVIYDVTENYDESKPTVDYTVIPDRDRDKAPVLEIKGLGIDFGGLTAVDEFTLSISPTEIAGIIGPNGAGKTTVFNLLTKVYQPTRGTFFFDGKDTAGMTTTQISRMGIARTFQNIRLFDKLTVEENVKTAMHDVLDYGLFSGLSIPENTKSRRKQPMNVPLNCSPFLTCRIWRTTRPVHCLTGPSEDWRS